VPYQAGPHPDTRLSYPIRPGMSILFFRRAKKPLVGNPNEPRDPEPWINTGFGKTSPVVCERRNFVRGEIERRVVFYSSS
jgi:hypothetical protein